MTRIIAEIRIRGYLAGLSIVVAHRQAAQHLEVPVVFMSVAAIHATISAVNADKECCFAEISVLPTYIHRHWHILPMPVYIRGKFLFNCCIASSFFSRKC